MILSDTLTPPLICGTAELTELAYRRDLAAVHAHVEAAHAGTPEVAPARLFDTAIAARLAFRDDDAQALQDMAVTATPLLRLRATSEGRPRVLALCGTGDLMVNTPLDFFTTPAGARLDLLFLRDQAPLPAVLPDHDVAVFAHGAPDGEMLARLSALHAAWPRPTLNDPALLPLLARDALAPTLDGFAEILTPLAVSVSRAAVAMGDACDTWPCLIRPRASHAGHGLARLGGPNDVTAYLAATSGEAFFLTPYVDYASADGLFRKYRIAFIGAVPHLAHMAVSDHWMVHYLNAGMTESAIRRAEEEAAMDDFASGFARRHAAALTALTTRIPLDLWSIDCAETRDGRLLLFEADIAAIIHLMDPPDMFPYKHRHMPRLFAAFADLLRERAAVGSGK